MTGKKLKLADDCTKVAVHVERSTLLDFIRIDFEDELKCLKYSGIEDINISKHWIESQKVECKLLTITLKCRDYYNLFISNEACNELKKLIEEMRNDNNLQSS